MIQIINYTEIKNSSTISTFSVILENLSITFHKLRLVKSKKGNLFISFPSYMESDFTGQQKWIPYFEIENEKDFKEKIMAKLKTFIKDVKEPQDPF